MDKRRRVCHLERPKILTATNHVAIRCLLITSHVYLKKKKLNYFYFRLYTILRAFSHIKSTDSKLHPVYKLSDRLTMVSLSCLYTKVTMTHL